MVKKRFLREMNFESEASEPALMSTIVFLVCQGEGKILEVCFCSEPISQSKLLFICHVVFFGVQPLAIL